jgi:hypothetical protein
MSRGHKICSSLIMGLVVAARVIWAQGMPDTSPEEPQEEAFSIGAKIFVHEEPSSRFAGRGDRDARIKPTVGDWALVWGPWESGGWTDILREPNSNATRLGQALMGDRVEVTQLRGEWAKVKEWGGAWEGWVKSADLTHGSNRVRKVEESMPIIVITKAPYLEIDGTGSRAPFGARLPISKIAGPHLELRLPDGRLLTVNTSDVAPAFEPKPLKFALSRAKGLLRLPFQSGGNSAEGIDGAGLAYLLLRACGHEVPRFPASLWEQATTVRREAMKPGDVVFFESFGGKEPFPAILVSQEALLEASPASGVNYLPIDQMSQRQLLEVRRFTVRLSRKGRGPRLTELPLTSTGMPFQNLDFLLLLAVAVSHQAVLLAFFLALQRKSANYMSGAGSSEPEAAACLPKPAKHPPGTVCVLRILRE